jgi:hypothetical protein
MKSIEIDSSTAELTAQQLCDSLSKESGCTVKFEARTDDSRNPGVVQPRFHRFYFEKEGDKGWRYKLDVYAKTIESQSADQLMGRLQSAKWQQVLQRNARARVPFFIDKGFNDPATFSLW